MESSHDKKKQDRHKGPGAGSEEGTFDDLSSLQEYDGDPIDTRHRGVGAGSSEGSFDYLAAMPSKASEGEITPNSQSNPPAEADEAAEQNKQIPFNQPAWDPQSIAFNEDTPTTSTETTDKEELESFFGFLLLTALAVSVTAYIGASGSTFLKVLSSFGAGLISSTLVAGFTFLLAALQNQQPPENNFLEDKEDWWSSTGVDWSLKIGLVAMFCTAADELRDLAGPLLLGLFVGLATFGSLIFLGWLYRWAEALFKIIQGGLGVKTLHQEQNKPKLPQLTKRNYSNLGFLALFLYHFIFKKPYYRDWGEHFLKIAAITLMAWTSWRFLKWIGKHIWKLISSLFAAVAAILLTVTGVVASNPHCLEPIGNKPDEILYCLEASTLEADLDLTHPALIAQSTLEKPRAQTDPYVWPVYDGQVQAAVTVSTEDTGQRFHSCMTQLYEKPAKNLESYARSNYLFSHDIAHDIALDTLVHVCNHYQNNRLENLEAYYTRSAINRMNTTARRSAKHRRQNYKIANGYACWEPSEEIFTVEDFEFLEAAISNLSAQHQEILRRYKKGGSFAEIAEDLSITRRQAYDRFDYAKDKLRTLMVNNSCRVTYTY